MDPSRDGRAHPQKKTRISQALHLRRAFDACSKGTCSILMRFSFPFTFPLSHSINSQTLHGTVIGLPRNGQGWLRSNGAAYIFQSRVTCLGIAVHHRQTLACGLCFRYRRENKKLCQQSRYWQCGHVYSIFVLCPRNSGNIFQGLDHTSNRPFAIAQPCLRTMAKFVVLT